MTSQQSRRSSHNSSNNSIPISLSDDPLHHRRSSSGGFDISSATDGDSGDGSLPNNADMEPLIVSPAGNKMAALEIDSNAEDGYDNRDESHLAEDDHHGHGAAGGASNPQLIVNIIISFVGAGILGIPEAFKQSGWLLGTFTLFMTSAFNVYAMLRLPTVQRVLQMQQQQGKTFNDEDGGGNDNQNTNNSATTESIKSYGDVGRCVMGRRGEILVNVCLAVSQAGFATAYIIFIAANLHQPGSFFWSRGFICLLCIPGLAFLCHFRDMKHLAPFSLLANCANFSALTIVLWQDWRSYKFVDNPDDVGIIHAVQWKGFLHVMGITLYSMEGVGMILSLQSSAKDQQSFPYILQAVLCAITIFMAFFGTAGYLAFGEATLAPVTLNLPHEVFAARLVKAALCVGLYLTYPIMMFPIWAISDRYLLQDDGNPNISGSSDNDSDVIKRKRMMFRSSLVVASACVAWMMPNFGEFLSLVGSSICTILGFILPCYFHYVIVLLPSDNLEIRAFTEGEDKIIPRYVQKGLNLFLIIFGAIFGVVGTLQSLSELMAG